MTALSIIQLQTSGTYMFQKMNCSHFEHHHLHEAQALVSIQALVNK